MRRRSFLSSSVSVSAASLAGVSASAQGAEVARELYELRRYQLRSGPRTAFVDAYMKDALFPALGRLGLGPVGAFNVMFGPDSPSLYVLITHKNAESFVTLSARLGEDAAYKQAAAAYMDVPATEPAFVRFESWLLHAFDGHPRLAVPAAAAQKQPRIFELRTYESHGEKAAKKKIEMFGKGGEIAIFRKTGLVPVFFGETLAGAKMPNLVYMVVFDDVEARERSWAKFRDDPDWKALSAMPEYLNTVSTIHAILLRPTAYSQI
jgi:hypothetical protein